MSTMNDLDATLARLSDSKAVLGVMILQRATGSIIRSTGPIFTASSVQEESTTAHLYAEKCWKVVQSCESDLSGLEDETASSNEGQNVRFLRIRLRRYELLITPGTSITYCRYTA